MRHNYPIRLVDSYDFIRVKLDGEQDEYMICHHKNGDTTKHINLRFTEELPDNKQSQRLLSAYTTLKPSIQAALENDAAWYELRLLAASL